MKKHLQALGPLSLMLILFSPAGFAQETETALPVETETERANNEDNSAPSGQEVEINEDNYRQFMELRDARQQRNILPEDAFKPSSGSQKLDELPEESQKHLRNQLREIIVQGNQWQPGDEGQDYPYVPSEAAQSNSQLQKKEAEAWGELVDSYHQREAQIYENSARTQAAMASENSSNGNPGGSSGGEKGSSEQAGEQGRAGEQTQPQQRSEQSSSKANEAPNTSKITSTSSSSGVSQNAMEFLKRMGQQDGGMDGAGASQEPQKEDAGLASGPGGPNAEPNEQGQQNTMDQNASADSVTGDSPNTPNAQSVAGTSQNAMEFIREQGREGNNDTDSKADAPSDKNGDGEQSDKADQLSMDEQNSDSDSSEADTPVNMSNETETDATAGDSQNALEYLMGDELPAQPGQELETGNAAGMTGTLSVGDLINARGVGEGRSLPPPVKIPDDQESGGKPPDKDGDG